MAYDPRRPHEHRYVLEPQEYPKGLLARVEKDALALCRALGYDLNTVEFAVEDGVPYAIDFLNPAPDFEPFSPRFSKDYVKGHGTGKRAFHAT